MAAGPFQREAPPSPAKTADSAQQAGDHAPQEYRETRVEQFMRARKKRREAYNAKIETKTAVVAGRTTGCLLGMVH